MTHSTQQQKTKPSRNTRKPLGPRGPTPPSSPPGIMAKPVNAGAKENRQVKPGRENTAEQKKARVLKDVTLRSQKVENISVQEADKSKESANDSVRIRMMEWEKERQRLRELEMNQESFQEDVQEQEQEHDHDGDSTQPHEDSAQHQEFQSQASPSGPQVDLDAEEKPRKVLQYTLPKLSFDKATISTFSDGLLTTPLSPLMESK